jgi:hypothetical protein
VFESEFAALQRKLISFIAFSLFAHVVLAVEGGGREGGGEEK